MTAKDTEDLPEAPAPQNGYHVTEQVGHLLRKAYQRHLSIFQTNASDPDLTSVQFVTLCALHAPTLRWVLAHPAHTRPRFQR